MSRITDRKIFKNHPIQQKVFLPKQQGPNFFSKK